MSTDAEYHRTFEKFSMGMWPIWKHDPMGFNYRGDAYHRKQQEDAYAKKINAFYAHQPIGGNLGLVRVMWKHDQNFVKYATAWEDAYSMLTFNWKRRVEPVVNENLTVVGHVGWFSASEIMIPLARTSILDIQSLIDAGDSIFAGETNPLPSYFHSAYVGKPEWKYRLVMAPDGKVERVLAYDAGHGAVSTMAPWEMISIARTGVLLGRAAVRYIPMLGRRGAARNLASGPTKEAAEKARTTSLPPPPPKPPFRANVIFGQPPQVRVGQFGRPGNLQGSVRIEGGQIVYQVDAIILKGATNGAEQAAIGVARQAHREMIVRAAKEAQKMGQKQFTLRGVQANPNFQAHADQLAKQIGVAGSGKSVKSITGAHPNYSVTLDVQKALASQ